jgi:hypothetical protein
LPIDLLRRYERCEFPDGNDGRMGIVYPASEQRVDRPGQKLKNGKTPNMDTGLGRAIYLSDSITPLDNPRKM